ncbi:hypothetical protein CVT24_008536 [Panaeolus cyanescens]|uniref:Uncharacterized protein n=1 Tax=Panaeolus cyanescens TaxID=181874 RepID=A0A409VKZ0_9AGAR|nr:hypothetical protein CVT24_008536 [Panaeolus cyanescens]
MICLVHVGVANKAHQHKRCSDCDIAKFKAVIGKALSHPQILHYIRVAIITDTQLLQRSISRPPDDDLNVTFHVSFDPSDEDSNTAQQEVLAPFCDTVIPSPEELKLPSPNEIEALHLKHGSLYFRCGLAHSWCSEDMSRSIHNRRQSEPTETLGSGEAMVQQALVVTVRWCWASSPVWLTNSIAITPEAIRDAQQGYISENMRFRFHGDSVESKSSSMIPVKRGRSGLLSVVNKFIKSNPSLGLEARLSQCDKQSLARFSLLASKTAPMMKTIVILLAAALAQAQNIIPLVDKKFKYPDGIPFKVDTDLNHTRGVQLGYNICNATTEGPTSLCQTAFINSLDDFCIWAPPSSNRSVGEIEGEMVAWCTKPGHGTRIIQDGAISGVQLTRTPDYIQVVGLIDQTKINMVTNDSGGEMDPHGADGRGNPMGGIMFTNAFTGHYDQVVEWHNFMGSNKFCLKACDQRTPNAARFCEHIFDRIGCEYNAPSNARDGVFESCAGESQDFPGVYTDSMGQVQTFSQPPESIGPIATIPYTPRVPSSSQCSQFRSAEIYGGHVTVPVPTIASTPTTVSLQHESHFRSASTTSTHTPTPSTPLPSSTFVGQRPSVARLMPTSYISFPALLNPNPLNPRPTEFISVSSTSHSTSTAEMPHSSTSTPNIITNMIPTTVTPTLPTDSATPETSLNLSPNEAIHSLEVSPSTPTMSSNGLKVPFTLLSSVSAFRSACSKPPDPAVPHIFAACYFCLWAPPNPGQTVGDIEGEMVAWCTKPGHGTRVIPAGTISGVQLTRTPDYIQVVGFMDQTKINMVAGDWGGEMDPHGADRRGNPIGGIMFTKAFSNGGYDQVVEWHNFMGANKFCLKACDQRRPNAAKYCEHIFDRIGCDYNAPSNARPGVFESCAGDSQDFPGIYTDSAGKTQTYTQPPESLGVITTIPYTARVPASSQCSQFNSAEIYGGGVTVPVPNAPAVPTSSVSSSSTRTSSSVSSTGVSSTSSSSSTAPPTSTPTPAPSNSSPNPNTPPPTSSDPPAPSASVGSAVKITSVSLSGAGAVSLFAALIHFFV